MQLFHAAAFFGSIMMREWSLQRKSSNASRQVKWDGDERVEGGEYRGAIFLSHTNLDLWPGGSCSCHQKVPLPRPAVATCYHKIFKQMAPCHQDFYSSYLGDGYKNDRFHELALQKGVAANIVSQSLERKKARECPKVTLYTDYKDIRIWL